MELSPIEQLDNESIEAGEVAKRERHQIYQACKRGIIDIETYKIKVAEINRIFEEKMANINKRYNELSHDPKSPPKTEKLSKIHPISLSSEEVSNEFVTKSVEEILTASSKTFDREEYYKNCVDSLCRSDLPEKAMEIMKRKTGITLDAEGLYTKISDCFVRLHKFDELEEALESMGLFWAKSGYQRKINEWKKSTGHK